MSDKSYKMVLLGNTSVGKSSFIYRYVSGKFSDYHEPTIGAAFMTKNILNNDKINRFEIWDTAGQERYKSLAPMYYRSASIALIVYDVTRIESFNGAKQWIDELNKNNPECKIYFIGNKIDLVKEDSHFKEEIIQYCQDNNIDNFFVSAKSNINIDNTFDYISNHLPTNFVDRKIKSTIVQIERENESYCC